MEEMKFCNDPVIKKRYNGASMPYNRVPMKKYGLDENWYGGNLKFVGECGENPILMMIGEENKTLAVAVLAKNEHMLNSDDRNFAWLPPLAPLPVKKGVVKEEEGHSDADGQESEPPKDDKEQKEAAGIVKEEAAKTAKVITHPPAKKRSRAKSK